MLETDITTSNTLSIFNKVIENLQQGYVLAISFLTGKTIEYPWHTESKSISITDNIDIHINYRDYPFNLDIDNPILNTVDIFIFSEENNNDEELLTQKEELLYEHLMLLLSHVIVISINNKNDILYYKKILSNHMNKFPNINLKKKIIFLIPRTIINGDRKEEYINETKSLQENFNVNFIEMITEGVDKQLYIEIYHKELYNVRESIVINPFYYSYINNLQHTTTTLQFKYLLCKLLDCFEKKHCTSINFYTIMNNTTEDIIQKVISNALEHYHDVLHDYVYVKEPKNKTTNSVLQYVIHLMNTQLIPEILSSIKGVSFNNIGIVQSFIKKMFNMLMSFDNFIVNENTIIYDILINYTIENNRKISKACEQIKILFDNKFNDTLLNPRKVCRFLDKINTILNKMNNNNNKNDIQKNCHSKSKLTISLHNIFSELDITSFYFIESMRALVIYFNYHINLKTFDTVNDYTSKDIDISLANYKETLSGLYKKLLCDCFLIVNMYTHTVKRVITLYQYNEIKSLFLYVLFNPNSKILFQIDNNKPLIYQYLTSDLPVNNQIVDTENNIRYIDTDVLLNKYKSIFEKLYYNSKCLYNGMPSCMLFKHNTIHLNDNIIPIYNYITNHLNIFNSQDIMVFINGYNSNNYSFIKSLPYVTKFESVQCFAGSPKKIKLPHLLTLYFFNKNIDLYNNIENAFGSNLVNNINTIIYDNTKHYKNVVLLTANIDSSNILKLNLHLKCYTKLEKLDHVTATFNNKIYKGIITKKSRSFTVVLDIQQEIYIISQLMSVIQIDFNNIEFYIPLLIKSF